MVIQAHVTNGYGVQLVRRVSRSAKLVSVQHGYAYRPVGSLIDRIDKSMIAP